MFNKFLEGRRNIKSVILGDYEVCKSEDVIYIIKDIDTERDLTSFKEAMRSPNSSKWLMAIGDE